MTTPNCDIAVLGLGVMGANLARNFASRGYRVAAYNRTTALAHRVAEEHPEANLLPCDTLETLVAALKRPRALVLMVPAGAPVDAMLDALDPLLESDDIVIDAGNSLYTDTDRRIERASDRPWRFVGMGVSGGSEGALLGPSMMPGGDPEAWEHLRPILESAAAVSDSGPCVTHCGRGSAGHFVKMIHNGIEYGDMQLIAEVATLLRTGLGLSPSAIADVFDQWNEGELQSYLIEITADVFRTPDPEAADRVLLDAILDRAGQKGTGLWTAHAALDLGVAAPTLTSAVEARMLSAQVDRRAMAAAIYPSAGDGRLKDVEVEQIGAALYAAKIASYTQGFELLARASEDHDYGTDLSEIARIWKAGCIIRARLLDRIRETFQDDPGAFLALAPGFRADLSERLPAWRKVVTAAMSSGLPVPGLAASLGWLDSLTTARGSANLIQAQRDYFGSHTFERLDRPGEAIHAEWVRR